MKVPALLIGGSLLAIFLAVAMAGDTLEGSATDVNGQTAKWTVNSELFESGTAWIVILELPDTLPDYLYDEATGEPMKFATSAEAGEYAILFLKGLGYG